MKRQRGLSLISTLIVGAILMAALLLAFKLVPVFNEYFAVRKGFNNVVSSVDAAAAPAEFRNAFSKQAQIDDITSVDPKSIQVEKNSGKVSLQVSYRREVPLFANVSLVFDFNVSSGN
jgi:hypothetical protein